MKTATAHASEPTIEPVWVSVSDAKKLCGLGTTKLYELIGSNPPILHSIKVGDKRLISYASIRALGNVA